MRRKEDIEKEESPKANPTATNKTADPKSSVKKEVPDMTDGTRDSDGKKEKKKEEDVKPTDWNQRKTRYLRFITLWLPLAAFILLLGSVVLTIAVPVAHWWVFAVILIALYVFLGLHKSDSENVEALLLFGASIKTLDPGLNFIPPIFCEVVTYPRKIIQIETGSPIRDRDGKIVPTQTKFGDQDVLVYTFDQPFRTTTASEKTATYKDDVYEKRFTGDSLHKRVTGDPHVVAHLIIEEAHRFYEKVRDISNLAALVDRELRSSVQNLLSEYTAAMAIDRMSEINERLTTFVEWAVGERYFERKAPTGAEATRWHEPWGVNVLRVSIPSLGLPRRVNESVADAAKAPSDRDAEVMQADAELQTREKLREVFNRPGGQTIAAMETARDVFRNTEKVFVVPGNDPLTNLAAMLTSSLDKKAPTAPQATPTPPKPEGKKPRRNKKT